MASSVLMVMACGTAQGGGTAEDDGATQGGTAVVAGHTVASPIAITTRRATEPEPVEASASQALSATPAASGALSPEPGAYAATGSSFSLDTCGFIVDPSQAVGRSLVAVKAGPPLLVTWAWESAFQVTCEVAANHTYRCAPPDQVVDFGFVGLEAVLTIRTPMSGVWLTNTSLLEYSGSTLTCVGKDCGKEPAVNFFGNLKNRVPCKTVSVNLVAKTAP